MAAVLATANEPDLKRLALLCLFSDMSSTNWEGAHAAFDPEGKTQLASFKTVCNKAVSKYKKALAEGAVANGTVSDKAGGGGEEAGVKPKKAAAGGKKRKGASETAGAEEDGDESKPKKAKAAPKPRAKKGGKKAEAGAEADEEVVKDEEED